MNCCSVLQQIVSKNRLSDMISTLDSSRLESRVVCEVKSITITLYKKAKEASFSKNPNYRSTLPESRVQTTLPESTRAKTCPLPTAANLSIVYGLTANVTTGSLALCTNGSLLTGRSGEFERIPCRPWSPGSPFETPWILQDTTSYLP